ncbi:MAG: hypothetical protein HY810_04040 [Candidatus Omnitrophica bacterium]|nr:hypothetical protein [Candidatus Omnitrophota bacterium]
MGSKVFKIFVAGVWIFFNLFLVGYAQQSNVTYEELKQKYTPKNNPEETYKLELELLAQGMYCYDLPIFDPAWRSRGTRIIYSSKYKHTAKKFDVLFKVYKEGKYAVIYFPSNKSEGPDFLYWDSSGWILDRTAVWDYIHYNYSNTGWFAYEGDYPYLEMLKKIFSLERVKLDSNVWAYQIK